MSEKKVVVRNVAIAIALACLLIGIGTGFVIAYATFGNVITKYNQLKADYDNLQANYSLLDAVKGFVFDNTIKVTVQIERGELWVEAKGIVTNIGNVTISKIYVFIFVYNKDGSLNAEYPYDTVIITNLNPSETNSFNVSFTGIYKGAIFDYMFKTFAIGNY
jgi:hypothetical protein